MAMADRFGERDVGKFLRSISSKQWIEWLLYFKIMRENAAVAKEDRTLAQEALLGLKKWDTDR